MLTEIPRHVAVRSCPPIPGSSPHSLICHEALDLLVFLSKTRPSHRLLWRRWGISAHAPVQVSLRFPPPAQWCGVGWARQSFSTSSQVISPSCRALSGMKGAGESCVLCTWPRVFPGHLYRRLLFYFREKRLSSTLLDLCGLMYMHISLSVLPHLSATSDKRL